MNIFVDNVNSLCNTFLMKTPSPSSHVTRQRLLKAATELLKQDGLPAITLRAVGDKAGVSRQTPYRHFADKDAMLAAVAVEGFMELEPLFASVHSLTCSPLEQLQGVLHLFIQFAFEHPARYLLMFSSNIREYPEVQASAHLVFEQFFHFVSQSYSSRFPHTDEILRVTALLFATVHGAVHLALAGHTESEKGLQDPEQLLLFLTGILQQT